MTPEQRKPDHTRLNIWLTFAGTVLAALIAGVFALLASGGDDKPEAAATTTAPPPETQPATATTEPAATAPATGPPATADDAGQPVRWSGKLIASTSGLSDAVDLDLRPPRSVDDTASEGDLSVSRLGGGQADLRKAALGLSSSFALWDQAGTPGFTQCVDAALARGVAELADVETGAVLCVRTNKERIARLTVRKIDARQGTVTFDSVIWDNA
jgi:hypothetical protein